MAEVTYNFTISTAFPNQKVNPGKLQSEIAADPVIVTQCTGIAADLAGDTCTVYFQAQLSPAEETRLGVIVAAHQGVGDPLVTTLASSKVLEGELSVTAQNPAWETLGGVVTAPTVFSANLNQLCGRVTAMVKVAQGPNGEKPRLRVTEDPEDTMKELLAPTELADTNGLWSKLLLYCETNNPRSGLRHYCVEAQLNQAASFQIKHVTVSLVRKIVPG